MRFRLFAGTSRLAGPLQPSHGLCSAAAARLRPGGEARSARRRSQSLVFAASASLLMVASGCRVARETAQLPAKAVAVVMPDTKSASPNLTGLQNALQRFADEFSARTVAAVDDYAEAVGTPEAAFRALSWKVSATSAAVGTASGPNPTANLLDMIALATVTRTALEEWVQAPGGDAFAPWLASSRVLETEAWDMAEGIFTPEQQQELRDAIRRWWDSNAGIRAGFFVRPQSFASLVRDSHRESSPPGSIFSLVGLDPTAGLDPAVREVTRTRLFAERAMYTAQRIPFLLRWQTELLAVQLLQNPQVSTTLTNLGRLTESADRLSRAAASLSQTAALVPDQLAAERQAILDAVDAQEGRLQELTVEVGRTLAAGERLATSLNATLITFEALMKRFGVGEPKAAREADTNATPFNILDYAHTADRISAMARQLDGLLEDTRGTLDAPALDRRIADLNALSGKARADAVSVLNRAFLLAAGLILLVFLCAMIYRRAARSGS